MTGDWTAADAALLLDGQRDALIGVAAWARADETPLAALQAAHAPAGAIASGLFALLFDLLAETGTDPAEWAARKQAELLAREADGS